MYHGASHRGPTKHVNHSFRVLPVSLIHEWVALILSVALHTACVFFNDRARDGVSGKTTTSIITIVDSLVRQTVTVV